MDVEEWRSEQRPVAQNANASGLFDQVQLRRVIAGVHDVDRFGAGNEVVSRRDDDVCRER